jgi:hypothetical protein
MTPTPEQITRRFLEIHPYAIRNHVEEVTLREMIASALSQSAEAATLAENGRIIEVIHNKVRQLSHDRYQGSIASLSTILAAAIRTPKGDE